MSDRKDYQYNDHVLKAERHKILTNVPHAMRETLKSLNLCNIEKQTPMEVNFKARTKNVGFSNREKTRKISTIFLSCQNFSLRTLVMLRQECIYQNIGTVKS